MTVPTTFNGSSGTSPPSRAVEIATTRDTVYGLPPEKLEPLRVLGTEIAGWAADRQNELIAEWAPSTTQVEIGRRLGLAQQTIADRMTALEIAPSRPTKQPPRVPVTGTRVKVTPDDVLEPDPPAPRVRTASTPTPRTTSMGPNVPRRLSGWIDDLQGAADSGSWTTFLRARDEFVRKSDDLMPR